MFSGEEYRLSEMAIRSFNPDPVSTDKMIKSSLLQTIFYDKIPERKLFYEKNERLHVNRLHDLLEPIRFDAFLDRMAVLKMKRGLTVLLYGAPGTGKTESVYQLARLSRRHVLEADASTVRSKWVGDTEKNIRNLFQDYKNACETFDEVPILLFNEADSILGKRRPVIDRVEQMENTLQNLLLQELENFEGIFIATTNLEDNLDPAFDRRILYKVRFTHPSDSLRISIWNDKLPNISNELIESVNTDFKLTGGQIDNIRKKIEVDKLLNPEMNVEESYLRNLAEEELSLRKGETRSSIGFLINQNDSDT
jgi:SpoVK/Ycf46/Vps4 family AAA+-type ATPase